MSEKLTEEMVANAEERIVMADALRAKMGFADEGNDYKLMVRWVRAADDALREIEGLESGACPLSERAAAIARAHRLAGREE